MDVYLLADFFTFLIILYFYFSRYHHYWQDHNIPSAKNTWPIIGNVSPINFLRNFGNTITNIYKDHPKNSMVGFYNYNIPCLLIRDLELIKSVLVTNFASFAENDLVLTEREEPLLAKNPFFTNGAEWKSGRSRLTSSLTGTKLKGHSQVMAGTMKKLTDYIDDKIAKSKNQIYEIDGKELMSKVTGEVGATVGFGIEGNCFDDSKQNESFVACGKLFFNTDLLSKIKFMVLLQIPYLLVLLQMPFVPKKFENFFRHLVKRSLENRKNQQSSQVRHFVDMIIEQEEKMKNPNTNDKIIAAHMLSFFLDLYETSSCTMTFVAYFIALHEHVQTKAREEVINTVKKHGDLNYEAIGDLVYLEQIILETLRLFPAINTQVKKCTQEIELVGPDGLRYLVKPEERVYISVDGLHRDPEIWKDPEVFMPERFSKESSKERNKMIHLPFGEGPRMCPGRQIAMVMAKMALASLLKNYVLYLSEKTRVPVELDNFMLMPYARGGMWLKLKKLS